MNSPSPRDQDLDGLISTALGLLDDLPHVEPEQRLRFVTGLIDLINGLLAETTAPVSESFNSSPRYPDAHVQLTGLDGNVFSIISRVRVALRAAGVSPAEVKAWTEECLQQPSYDDVLQLVMRTVSCS